VITATVGIARRIESRTEMARPRSPVWKRMMPLAKKRLVPIPPQRSKRKTASAATSAYRRYGRLEDGVANSRIQPVTTR
jgi:hypothetical protein